MFDQVADGVRALVPTELGQLRVQARRWGLKAWFDAEECPRGHYEAQVISAEHVAGAEVLAVEIGFHAEHPKPAQNEAAMAPVRAAPAARRRAMAPALWARFRCPAWKPNSPARPSAPAARSAEMTRAA